MPKARTHSFKGKIFSEIPEEIAEALGLEERDELEFKEIAKGIIIVQKPGKAQASERKLVEEEIDVIRKVNNIFSTDRTVEKINSILDQKEKEIFQDLLARRVFFKFNKNRKTIIGLDKKYLPIVISPKRQEPRTPGIFEKGYAVIENEHEAEELSRMLTEEGKEDLVRGVRGFDQKYYVVTKEKLAELEWRILSAIDGKRNISQVSEELKEDPQLVRACVEVLREEGKIIEKRKGVYERV